MEKYIVNNVEATIYDDEDDYSSEGVVLMVQGDLYIRGIGDIFSGFHQLSTVKTEEEYVTPVRLELDGQEFKLFAHIGCNDFRAYEWPRKGITLHELEQFINKEHT